jgi:hypothetical protein
MRSNVFATGKKLKNFQVKFHMPGPNEEEWQTKEVQAASKSKALKAAEESTNYRGFGYVVKGPY